MNPGRRLHVQSGFIWARLFLVLPLVVLTLVVLQVREWWGGAQREIEQNITKYM